MLASKKPGLEPKNVSRQRSYDGSVLLRRRVQPQIRRSIDGFVVSKPKLQASSQSNNLISKPGFVANKKTRTIHPAKPALPRQARSAVLARQVVQTKRKKPSKSKNTLFSVPALLVLLAASIFITGGFISYRGWKANRNAAVQVKVLSSSIDNENGTAVSEDEISLTALASYQVAPESAKYLKIPRLEVNSRVTPVNIQANGTLGAPRNVKDAGWYEGSSKPGAVGAVLITGYVHGPSKQGVFYRLGNLKPGDTVEIERGDARTITYKVVSSENVDQNNLDMAKVQTSIEPGKPGLNLVTHTGRYDTRTNKYEQRLIVYAVQQ